MSASHASLIRALCHEWNSWAGMKEPVTGILCCVLWMGHWDFLGLVWMNFSRAEGAHVADPSEVGHVENAEVRLGSIFLGVYLRVPAPAPQWSFREWGTHLSTNLSVPKNHGGRASRAQVNG